MPDGDDDFYVDSPAKIDYDKCLASGDGLFNKEPPYEKGLCPHTQLRDLHCWAIWSAGSTRTYHTITRRDGRAIAGLSMGGFGAMSIGMRHTDEFAAAASHSGAIALLYRGPRPFVPGKPAELYTNIGGHGASDLATDGNPIIGWIAFMLGTDLATWKAHDVVDLATAMPPGKLALYIDCGTEDDFHLQDNVRKYVREALTARHIAHEFFIGPGKHNFDFWGPRLARQLRIPPRSHRQARIAAANRYGHARVSPDG